MTIAPSLCSPLALADAEPTHAAEPWESDVITAYGLLREALPDHLLEIDSLWMSQLADERELVLGKLRRVRDNARRWPNGRPNLGSISPADRL